jgi:PBS lyase HEAT-like repeat
MSPSSHSSIFIFFAYGVLILLLIIVIFSFGVIFYNLISVHYQKKASIKRGALKGVISAYLAGVISIDSFKKTVNNSHEFLVSLVAQMSESADADTRLKLIRIFTLCQCEFLIEHEFDNLYSSDWKKREHAATYLPFITTTSAFSAKLIDCLEDEVLEVRLAAARALAELQLVSAINPILHHLALPGSRPIARLIELLMHFDDRAIPCLLEYLNVPNLSGAGYQIAITVLGKKRVKNAVPIISKFTTHQELEVRIQAFRALGEIADESSLSMLISGAMNLEWEIRAICSNALIRYSGKEVIAALQHGLTDSIWWVRFNSANALASLGPPGKLALEETLISPDRFAREMSLMALDGGTSYSPMEIEGKR